MMLGEAPEAAPAFANLCYSFVDDRQAMHIATLYRYDPAKRSMLAEGPGILSDHASTQEGTDADAWARQIWSDTLD
jgi:murein endopeptidase